MVGAEGSLIVSCAQLCHFHQCVHHRACCIRLSHAIDPAFAYVVAAVRKSLGFSGRLRFLPPPAPQSDPYRSAIAALRSRVLRFLRAPRLLPRSPSTCSQFFSVGGRAVPSIAEDAVCRRHRLRLVAPRSASLGDHAVGSHIPDRSTLRQGVAGAVVRFVWELSFGVTLASRGLLAIMILSLATGVSVSSHTPPLSDSGRQGGRVLARRRLHRRFDTNLAHSKCGVFRQLVRTQVSVASGGVLRRSLVFLGAYAARYGRSFRDVTLVIDSVLIC